MKVLHYNLKNILGLEEIFERNDRPQKSDFEKNIKNSAIFIKILGINDHMLLASTITCCWPQRSHVAGLNNGAISFERTHNDDENNEGKLLFVFQQADRQAKKAFSSYQSVLV
jgi:hypothetical protein